MRYRAEVIKFNIRDFACCDLYIFMAAHYPELGPSLAAQRAYPVTGDMRSHGSPRCLALSSVFRTYIRWYGSDLRRAHDSGSSTRNVPDR